MVVSAKLAALAMGGLMLVAAYTPALAGSASPAATAPAATAPAPEGSSLGGILNSLGLNDVTTHQAQKKCKPDTLYSQHSVVGDPDACFIGQFDMRAGSLAGIPSAL